MSTPAPSAAPSDAPATPLHAFDLGDHEAVRAALATIADALARHNKTDAVRGLNDIDAILGTGWHPARRPVRGAEAAVDIGHWDLAGGWLIEIGSWFNPHPAVESENT